MQVTNASSALEVGQTLDRLNAPSRITSESAAASLDSADFLRLMTAQLANQDPLEPQSNEQMLAQLAQFSSLESEIASKATLDEISAKLSSPLNRLRMRPPRTWAHKSPTSPEVLLHNPRKPEPCHSSPRSAGCATPKPTFA